MADDKLVEVYRLSIPNHNGPTLLISRTASELREALLGFWDELCPGGIHAAPEIPEDGIALDIEPTEVTAKRWREACEFEWEGFLP
jgi:hypothetical protein